MRRRVDCPSGLEALWGWEGIWLELEVVVVGRRGGRMGARKRGRARGGSWKEGGRRVFCCSVMLVVLSMYCERRGGAKSLANGRMKGWQGLGDELAARLELSDDGKDSSAGIAVDAASVPRSASHRRIQSPQNSLTSAASSESRLDPLYSTASARLSRHVVRRFVYGDKASGSSASSFVYYQANQD